VREELNGDRQKRNSNFSTHLSLARTKIRSVMVRIHT
jgi:hypothetical protein